MQIQNPVFFGHGYMCFPGGLDDKESVHSAGDLGSIPGSGRFPGNGRKKGNGHPLQCSCLENSIDRGAWQATVHGVSRVGHDLMTTPPFLKQFEK